MRVSFTLFKLVLSVFVVTFSTVAVAQHLIGSDDAAPTARESPPRGEIRELPVFFPQGRLYCVQGSLAYQKLYPQGWQRISSEDAVKVASQSVEDNCLGGDPYLCKEYRSRLSKLRLAVRGCFKVSAS